MTGCAGVREGSLTCGLVVARLMPVGLQRPDLSPPRSFQRLKAAVHYTVGCLCQDVAEDKDVQFSKQTIAAISEVTFRQCGTELRLLPLCSRATAGETMLEKTRWNWEPLVPCVSCYIFKSTRNSDPVFRAG